MQIIKGAEDQGVEVFALGQDGTEIAMPTDAVVGLVCDPSVVQVNPVAGAPTVFQTIGLISNSSSKVLGSVDHMGKHFEVGDTIDVIDQPVETPIASLGLRQVTLAAPTPLTMGRTAAARPPARAVNLQVRR